MPDDGRDKNFIKKLLVSVSVICLTVILLAVLYYTFDVLLLIFAAALLAIFLRGLADILSRYINISEGWSVLLVSVLLTAVLAGAIALLAPDVAEQMRHLRVELPKSAAAAGDYISQYSAGRTLIEQLPSIETVRANVSASTLLSGVGGFFSTTVGAIGNFFIVILLAIYLASEPRLYCRGFTSLFPLGKRTRVREVLFAISDTLRWWLIGKVGSMIFIGLLTWVGLYFLSVPLALTLGLIAGLLSFIPNFGPIISALPALLLAFIDSPIKAVYVLALFVGVQLIESNLVTPLIERETVELPPALTIIFQLALAVLVGGLGLVLATPLLAVIMVLVQMVYIQDVLGDRNIEVNEKLGELKIKRESGELAKEDSELARSEHITGS
ncbi:MAG: AI-2E family transporter [Saprospiraceae bacterium]|nr:AI-2E family transporter [Pyrinomonadaceae bacterium]